MLTISCPNYKVSYITTTIISHASSVALIISPPHSPPQSPTCISVANSGGRLHSKPYQMGTFPVVPALDNKLEKTSRANAPWLWNIGTFTLLPFARAWDRLGHSIR